MKRWADELEMCFGWGVRIPQVGCGLLLSVGGEVGEAEGVGSFVVVGEGGVVGVRVWEGAQRAAEVPGRGEVREGREVRDWCWGVEGWGGGEDEAGGEGEGEEGEEGEVDGGGVHFLRWVFGGLLGVGVVEGGCGKCARKSEGGSGGGSRRGEERWKRVTGDLNPEAVSLYRKPNECQLCPKEIPPKRSLGNSFTRKPADM